MLMKYKDFKMMSKEEMKTIKGGNPPGSGGTCNDNSDCSSGQKCDALPGLPKVCTTINVGTSCQSDTDCGNAQSCVTNNTGGSPAKWCVTGS